MEMIGLFAVVPPPRNAPPSAIHDPSHAPAGRVEFVV